MKDNDGYGGGTIISRKFVQRNWGESRKPSAKVFDIPGEIRSATSEIEGLTVRADTKLLGAVWLT